MHNLQVLCNTFIAIVIFIAIVTTPVGWMPQVIVILACLWPYKYKLLMHYCHGIHLLYKSNTFYVKPDEQL